MIAARSLSPHAMSFQTRTMAIHRASPTLITPVRKAGSSGSSSHARTNISSGPTTQDRISELANRARSSMPSERICPRPSQRTLASTGYIITSRPIAIGSDTVPTRSASSHVSSWGTADPSTSPPTIARPIHTGRNRSSRDSCPATWPVSACKAVSAPLQLRFHRNRSRSAGSLTQHGPAELLQSTRHQSVVGEPAPLLLLKEPCAGKHAQVVAHARLAEPERRLELADADRVGAVGKQIQYANAMPIRNRLE